MSITKLSIKEHTKNTAQLVEDGELDALEVFVQAKKEVAKYTAIVENLEPKAREVAEMRSEKSFKEYGATISKKSGSARYDYSQDHIISELQEELSAVQARINDRMELVKTAIKVSNPIWGEDGIQIERLDPVDYTKDSISVTID